MWQFEDKRKNDRVVTSKSEANLRYCERYIYLIPNSWVISVHSPSRFPIRGVTRCRLRPGRRLLHQWGCMNCMDDIEPSSGKSPRFLPESFPRPSTVATKGTSANHEMISLVNTQNGKCWFQSYTRFCFECVLYILLICSYNNTIYG